MFIQRIVLVLLVLSCSVGLAQAEWIKVGTSSDDMTVYADSTTRRIDKKSGLVKMWSLYDFNTVQNLSGKYYLSSIGQNQYDCEEERTQLLAVSYFDGHMAGGNVVNSGSNEDPAWHPIAPHSVNEAVWKVACGIAKP